MNADFDPDRFFRTLVHQMPDAVIYADGKGVIRFWNAGAERIFGFGAAEALGKPLDIIIPESLRARHWAGFDQTMRTGRSRFGAGDVLAVPASRKDGARISIEFTVVPFRDEAGRMLGIGAVLRDVTTRFEEMRSLRRQLAAGGRGADQASEGQAKPQPGHDAVMNLAPASESIAAERDPEFLF